MSFNAPIKGVIKVLGSQWVHWNSGHQQLDPSKNERRSDLQRKMGDRDLIRILERRVSSHQTVIDRSQW